MKRAGAEVDLGKIAWTTLPPSSYGTDPVFEFDLEQCPDGTVPWRAAERSNGMAPLALLRAELKLADLTIPLPW